MESLMVKAKYLGRGSIVRVNEIVRIMNNDPTRR